MSTFKEMRARPVEWPPDGWGGNVRIGVLVPHADVGPESELQAMAPAGVVIHAARVPFGAMAAGGAMDPTIALAPVRAFSEPPHVDDATELLASASPHAIAYAFTSSAYAIGVEGETAMIARLQERSNRIPVVAASAATADALRGLGARRISLVSPPWFDAELDGQGRRYYEDSGFAVVASGPCGLPSDQASITPDGLFDWVVAHTPDEAEAVAIGGNGFRAVGTIAALEAQLERPVVTANQALLWASLGAAGADASTVSGYGHIFERIPEHLNHEGAAS